MGHENSLIWTQGTHRIEADGYWISLVVGLCKKDNRLSIFITKCNFCNIMCSLFNFKHCWRYMISVLAGTFQNLQLRRCWMSGDPSSVPSMSPCKEQSATLSSFYPPLCPRNCTTTASSKQILTLLPFQKPLEFYTVTLQMVVHILHLSAEGKHLQLVIF